MNIVTIHLLLDINGKNECADMLSEFLRENQYIADWSYQGGTANFQLYDGGPEYKEGDFLEAVRVPPALARLETVVHDGNIYQFDPESASSPIIGDGVRQSYRESNNVLVYGFALSGNHSGPAMLIEMVNPNYETEDGSTSYVWDSLRWADDKTPLEDTPVEYYSDALREILGEIINETWD